MKTICLNIPDSLAKAADEEGLLETQSIQRILREALRRKSASMLLNATQPATETDAMNEAQVNEFVGRLTADVRSGRQSDHARSA